MVTGLSTVLGCVLALATAGTVSAASLASSPAAAATTQVISTGWPNARQISDVTMYELSSAVDSAGHVYVVGSTQDRGAPLYLLTNTSGPWVQSTVARSARKGAITDVAVTVDTDESVWVLFTRWSFWNPCGLGGCPPRRSELDGIYVLNNVGGTWSDPVRLPSRFRTGQNGFRVRNGSVHLAYERRPRGGEGEIWYATNAGRSWSSRKVGLGWGPHLALDANSDPWIAYTAPEYAGGVIVAHANGVGGTFTKSRAPGTAAEIETASVDGFDLDTAGRPVVLFDRYESGEGYWTYWVRLGNRGWTAPHRLFNSWGTDFDVDSHDRIHFLYNVGDYTRADGLYYGTSTGRIADTRRIDRSTRVVEDGPSAASSLVVDSAGKPHVVFAIPYNDNRLGLWCMAGPIAD